MINWIKKYKFSLLLLVLLTGMSLILYKDYIFGGKLFLFEDFGSDSVRISLPTYIYYFDWFRSGMPLWSDKMGIGTSILSHGEIVFDPFTYILYLFGRNSIIYMFVYLVVVKIILSGFFFWLFIGKYSNYKFSPFSKIIGSLTYAFGGYMLVMGQNFVFGTIYVYLPLILYGFELWLQDKKKLLFIFILFATALYFYYLFYMTAFFVGVYAIFRYFSLYTYEKKHFFSYLFSIAGYGLLALGLSAFYWLPAAILTSSNLRVASGAPPIDSLFTFDPTVMLTVFARLLGIDSLGNVMNYAGYNTDYYELPLYCGVITALLIPQVFCEADKRKKAAYGILSILLAMLLFVPFFSYVMNGFSAITYRWAYILSFSFSLFIATAVNIVYEKRKINFKLLFITGGFLFAASLLAINHLDFTSIKADNLYIQLELYKHYPLVRKLFLINLKVFIKDYILIIFYIVLTFLFFRTRYKKVIKVIILIVVCSELLWFPARSINDRLTTTPDPVKNHLGYFDNTNSAVRYLDNIDNSFYRVDKSYDSVKSEFGRIPSDNEAMVQDYRGIKSYNSNNQPNYIRFLQNAGVFVVDPKLQIPAGVKPQDIIGADLNFINGVGDRYLLQSFLGVKYYLTKSDQPKLNLPQYYHYITTTDGINIYKNSNYLPLGFTFDQYIINTDFQKLDNHAKDLALLSFVIINEQDSFIKKGNLSDLKNNDSQQAISKLVKERRANSYQITSYQDDAIKGKITTKQKSILVFTIPYDKGWSASVDGHKIQIEKIDNGLIGIPIDIGEHTVDLDYFPSGMKTGIVISCITLVLFIVFAFYNKYMPKKLWERLQN